MDSLISKGYYYSDPVTGKLIHSITKAVEEKEGASAKDVMSLTQMEIGFLKLACTELTYREIADKICLLEFTRGIVK